jgi:hypothetical protein
LTFTGFVLLWLLLRYLPSPWTGKRRPAATATATKAATTSTAAAEAAEQFTHS